MNKIIQLYKMQYGRLRIESIQDFDVSISSIGKQLEQEFDNQAIPVTLPTEADWGYTFRVNISKRLIDISIVDQGEDGYGIALESPKDVFGIFISQNLKNSIEMAKSILSEALSKIGIDYTLYWFSKDEWLAAFGTDFWQ